MANRIVVTLTIGFVVACAALAAPARARLTASQTAVLNTRLVRACEAADVGAITKLLRRGANPNGSGRLFDDDPELTTPLAMAASDGSVDVCKLLVAHGAKIDLRDSSGVTPLMTAASAGRSDVFNYLLLKGARINATDDDGLTPLMWAALGERAGIAEIAFAHGAHPNASCASGTALFMAAKTNRGTAVMQLLLDHGARVDAGDYSGVTPMMEALSVEYTVENNPDHPRAAFLIAHGANIDAPDRNGNTPIIRATIAGDAAGVKLLLAHRANTRLANAAGDTALSIAQRENNQAIVDLLSPPAAADQKTVR